MYKENKKISIIIPVYNIEEYIEECIVSVQNQTFRDIEILLVDDGSTDRSLAICETCAKLDDRIRVFTKKNGGPSSARNLGIKKASGDYVLFLDGDDALLEGSLARLNEILAIEKPDLMTCDYVTSIKKQRTTKINIDTINNLNDYLKKSNDIPWATWRSIYRKDIIKDNDLKFKEELICAEDCDFFMNYFEKCKKRIYVNLPIVEYRIIREGSITNNIKYSTIRSELKTFSDYYRRYRDRNDYIVSGLFAKKYINTISTIYNLNNREEIRRVKKIINKDKDVVRAAKGRKYIIAKMIFGVFGYYNGSKLLRKIKDVR